MKNKMTAIVLASFLSVCASSVSAEVNEVKVPLGAGGFGFLPLHIMKSRQLIEKHAQEAGVTVKVNWSNIGGPSGMIDALLSGSADFISAGPPSFLILWDKTKGNANVKGVASMSSMPMRLNTRAEHLKTIDDLKAGDKIAVTSVKSSIPSIVMQMYAVQKYGKQQAFKFDPFTVTMNHSDAAAALLTGTSITGHFASAPLDQRELKSPGVRTIMNTDDVMGGSTTFTMISTTQKFHDQNPKVYGALVAALKEAQELIMQDKPGAVKVLLESMGGGANAGSAEDMIAILNEPTTKYTITPEHVMKYATFMNEIGSLKNKPASIDELFFQGSDVSGGN